MTLFGTILKKVKSTESLNRDLSSPPPELEKIPIKKKKKPIFKYRDVKCKVDTSPPLYCLTKRRKLDTYVADYKNILYGNIDMIMAIRAMDFYGGKVDHYWKKMPPPNMQHYHTRKNFLNHVHFENRIIYKRLLQVRPKVETAESHRRDWIRNRKEIVTKAQGKFVLFPPIPTEDIEDTAFIAPDGEKRPRVFIELKIRNAAKLGALQVELFTDICPKTCQLFLELLRGDGVGFGYIGTKFFTKVPQLYWSGGDVAYNSGFGCYAQRGRTVPIGAENYHFSHSITGLLSMSVTCDDEVCGIFNITFKPLTQFDLQNVVFGRVIRPSNTFEVLKELGSALSVQPVVEISATRYKHNGRWVCGEPNRRLATAPKWFNSY